jgi:hypothetical protein
LGGPRWAKDSTSFALEFEPRCTSRIVYSGFAGVVLDAVYLLSGRCLRTCVLAHGFIDTFGVVLLYFGLSD